MDNRQLNYETPEIPQYGGTLNRQRPWPRRGGMAGAVWQKRRTNTSVGVNTQGRPTTKTEE